jgi:hypothetical protein
MANLLLARRGGNTVGEAGGGYKILKPVNYFVFIRRVVLQ